MDGHKMSQEAKWRVSTRFFEHGIDMDPILNSGIWLHIDDGKMGGGENVGFEEYVSSADWGIQNGYFDHQDQKFHYGLMAHLCEDDPDSKLGRADAPGDDLCLFDENIDSAHYQAHVFMHELGHNLIGNYYEPGSDEQDHNPEAGHLITARFSVDTYELTIDSTSGGNVTLPGEGSFTYKAGEEVEIEAVANEDYHFTGWTGDDGSERNTITISMMQDIQYLAPFKLL